jgi:hypothetical protein
LVSEDAGVEREAPMRRERYAVALSPTSPFLVQIILWIEAAAKNGPMIGLPFLHDKDLSSMGADKELVAGLKVERLASFTRDYDLVLRG